MPMWPLRRCMSRHCGLFGGKQVHDANIIATMKVYGIPALLTRNTEDFERFREVVRIEGI